MLRRRCTFPKIFFTIVFLLFVTIANAQVELALTVTDNIVTNAFSFEPPKPAPAKSIFKTTGEKGVQVFFYFNATGTSTLAKEGYRVRLKAYKLNEDKEEWFNELTYLLKKDDKYGVIAMNFLKSGQYKIVILNNADQSKQLATATFAIEKN